MAMLHSLITRRRFGPLRKALTSGLVLDDMCLAGPVMVQLLVELLRDTVELAMSTRLCLL